MKNYMVYMPFPVKNNKINESTLNLVNILGEKYKMIGNLAEPTNLSQMMQTKAVLLNWTEQCLDGRMKLQLILHKCFGVRIIWAFHNKYPHDMPDDDGIKSNMKWLADHSDVIMLHSRNSRRFIPNLKRNGRKAFFLPHILFSPHNENEDLSLVKQKYGIGEDDFVFTMFGTLRPYKNIEGCIEAFQKLHLDHAKLIIAGNSADHKYASTINKMCVGNPNIITRLHFLSNRELDNVIDISDVVVMPYKDRSSMNSGVMIHAFSKGKTVITPDICMARDMASEGFFYMYKYSLEKAMRKAYENGKEISRSMGERARAYVYEHNNKEIVQRRAYEMVEKKRGKRWL